MSVTPGQDEPEPSGSPWIERLVAVVAFVLGVVVVLAIGGVTDELVDLTESELFWVLGVAWFVPVPFWFRLRRDEPPLPTWQRAGGVLVGGPAMWGGLVIIAATGFTGC